MKEYAPKAQDIIKKASGRILAAGQKVTLHRELTGARQSPTLLSGGTKETAASFEVRNAPSSIALRLHRWRLAIGSLPPMRTVSSLYSAAYCPMELTRQIIFGARRPMPIAFSRAASRLICRCRHLPSMC